MTLNFFLLLAANTLFYLGFQALFPTLPIYIVEQLGGTPIDNGLATFVFAAASVLARPFLGGLTDRWGRKPLMLAGAVIFVAAPACFAASRSVAMLLAARAFHGLGMAAFTTAYQALVVDLAAPERRGQALGWSANSMAVAFISGPLLGDAVLARLGFGPLFFLSAASAALCVGLVMVVKAPPVQGAQAALLANLRDALAQRQLRAGLVGMSFMGIVFGAYLSFVPLYAQAARLGAPGAYFTVYAAALLLVQAGAGRLSDRVGRARVAVPGMGLIGVSMLALALAGSAWAGLAAAFLYGLASGAARTAMDGLVADSVPPQQRATAMALQFTSYDLLIGLGGALMGPLAQAAGYPAMYALAGVLALVGALAFARCV